MTVIYALRSERLPTTACAAVGQELRPRSTGCASTRKRRLRCLFAKHRTTSFVLYRHPFGLMLVCVYRCPFSIIRNRLSLDHRLLMGIIHFSLFQKYYIPQLDSEAWAPYCLQSKRCKKQNKNSKIWTGSEYRKIHDLLETCEWWRYKGYIMMTQWLWSVKATIFYGITTS